LLAARIAARAPLRVSRQLGGGIQPGTLGPSVAGRLWQGAPACQRL